jgi:hypothetical protein
VKNSEGNTGGQCSKRGGGGGRNYCAAVSQTDNPAPEPEKEVAEEDREILRMNASCHPAGTTSGGHHFMSAPQPSTPSAPPPSTCRGREQEQLLADSLPGTPAAQYTLHRPAGRVVQPPGQAGVRQRQELALTTRGAGTASTSVAPYAMMPMQMVVMGKGLLP